MKSKPIVDHLSYSAIRSFMTSPYKFWMNYVNREGFTSNLPMLVGSAWHKGLEEYFLKENDYVHKGVDYLVKHVNEARDVINENKLEKFDKDFLKAMKDLGSNLESYAGIEREWEASRHIECKVRMLSPVGGGLGISGMIDVIDVDGNPTDHKYVGRFSNGTESYIIQGWFYYYLTHQIIGKYPDYFRISEFKKTINRDGSSQLKELILFYEPGWINKIDSWYVEVCEQILNQKHFVSNPFQFFGGEDWKEYLKS